MRLRPPPLRLAMLFAAMQLTSLSATAAASSASTPHRPLFPQPAPAAVQANRRAPAGSTVATATLPAMPTDADLARARLFEEPLVRVGPGPETAPARDRENRDLADALRRWIDRRDPDDMSALTRFLERNPDSSWRAALQTDLGIIYFHQGYFLKAIDAWSDAWTRARDDASPAGSAVADRAVAELALLYGRLGRVEALEPLLAEVGTRDVRGSAGQKLAEAREGLWLMHEKPGDSFRCGPFAVSRVLAVLRPGQPYDPRIDAVKSTPHGLPLSRVAQLAGEAGLNLRLAFRPPDAAEPPLPAVMHWKAGHFAALVGSMPDAAGRPRYHVEDPTFGEDLWIGIDALRTEGSGYFLIPAGPLPAGWRTVSLEEASRVWGRGQTSSKDNTATSDTDQKSGGDDGSCKGMPRYAFHSMLVSLNVMDTPVGYQPPVGPAIAFTVTYNQKDAYQPSTFSYSNLGPKWTFDPLSYVTDTPTNPAAGASIYLRGGGVETYSGYSSSTKSYAPQYDSQATLVWTSSSSYERRLPDGSKEIFSQPDGATAYPRKVFLTSIVDPQGNALELSYDASLRLTAITDAIGQVTLLSYDLASDPLKVTAVTDPFGRTARLEYNAAGQLARITDQIGMSSSFAYSSGDFISSMTTPYGTTTFQYGVNPSDSQNV